MLLAKFKLHFESARPSHRQHVTRVKRHVRESLTAFDSRETEIGAEVQVSGQAILCDGNLVRASSGDRGYPIFLGRRDLAPRRVFISHYPARHGYLQNRHQVRALFQVAFQRRWIVAGVERAG